MINSIKCKQTEKSEAFHEIVFDFKHESLKKNKWGILKFFFRYKEERGEAEGVRNKATQGKVECDKARLARS